MRYAMNLRAEANENKRDDPMAVDQMGNGGGDQQSSGYYPSGGMQDWDPWEMAINIMKGKGKEKVGRAWQISNATFVMAGGTWRRIAPRGKARGRKEKEQEQ